MGCGVSPFLHHQKENMFGDIWRHSFPKGLQYCKQCLILHSTVSSIAKRYKHKRYIPRNELHDALDSFVAMPGAPVTRWPIVRHVLFVRWINSVRVTVFGRPAWLFTPNVAKEHHKIVEWLKNDMRRTTNKKLEKFVDREKFQKEVLGNFHVAAMYHRVFRLGIALCAVLVLLVVFELFFAQLLALYLRCWRGMDEDGVLEYFREITQRHAISDVPPAYANKLPPPCVLMEIDGERVYHVEVCELVSPDEGKRVIVVPCPCVGPRTFFEAVGSIARNSDAILLEGVPESHIYRVAPTLLLPMKTPTFEAFQLHHKYFDIIHNNKREPPKLCASLPEVTMLQYIVQSVVPLTLRYILMPTLVSGTKADARNAWAHLKELLEDEELLRRHPQSTEGAHYTICVPWSVGQTVNLEASLVKMGYRLHRHYSVPWLAEDYIGNNFLGRSTVK